MKYTNKKTLINTVMNPVMNTVMNAVMNAVTNKMINKVTLKNLTLAFGFILTASSLPFNPAFCLGTKPSQSFPPSLGPNSLPEYGFLSCFIDREQMENDDGGQIPMWGSHKPEFYSAKSCFEFSEPSTSPAYQQRTPKTDALISVNQGDSNSGISYSASLSSTQKVLTWEPLYPNTRTEPYMDHLDHLIEMELQVYGRTYHLATSWLDPYPTIHFQLDTDQCNQEKKKISNDEQEGLTCHFGLTCRVISDPNLSYCSEYKRSRKKQ